MKKMKNYRKPAMTVVELQQRCQLLQGTTNNPPIDPGSSGAREQRSDWNEED